MPRAAARCAHTTVVQRIGNVLQAADTRSLDLPAFLLAAVPFSQASAKLVRLLSSAMILDALTDMQMLRYLGRGNGEDYGWGFLTMLSTWAA